MSTARLIVCERRGEWAVALRRELATDGVRLRETRSLDECWQELQGFRSSFVALEAACSNVEGVAGLLMRIGRCHPQSRAICVASREMESAECLLREAGAVNILYTTRQIGAAVRMIRRHFAGIPERESLRENVWERLPWKH